jgi:competence protein ComEC
VVEPRSDSNSQSIAFRLDYNDLNLFFGGDLPASVEDKLSSNIGDVEVLKVSHHGSKTSTSTLFLDHITPEFAIISVGINNSYDHPHQQVIDNLQSRKVQIKRTDLQGTQVLLATETNFEMISTDKCQYYCAYRLYLKKYLP